MTWMLLTICKHETCIDLCDYEHNTSMILVHADQTDQRQVLPHDGSNSITGTGLIAAKCLWLLHESMMEGWQTIARSLGKKEESFTLCTGHFPVCCPACRVLCPLPLGKESRR